MFSTTYPLLVTYVSMCDCELCTVTHTYTYLLDYIFHLMYIVFIHKHTYIYKYINKYIYTNINT